MQAANNTTPVIISEAGEAVRVIEVDRNSLPARERRPGFLQQMTELQQRERQMERQQRAVRKMQRHALYAKQVEQNEAKRQAILSLCPNGKITEQVRK